MSGQLEANHDTSHYVVVHLSDHNRVMVAQVDYHTLRQLKLINSQWQMQYTPVLQSTLK